MVVVTHDLLFTFPFLFRPLSFVSPFALCTPFFGAECVIFAASFCIFAISPFCFQFVRVLVLPMNLICLLSMYVG